MRTAYKHLCTAIEHQAGTPKKVLKVPVVEQKLVATGAEMFVGCREEIQLVREHHPYEKEFVVESRPTGRERELPNSQPDDLLETSLREVERTIPDVCEGAPVSLKLWKRRKR